jgi:hypothetical protein
MQNTVSFWLIRKLNCHREGKPFGFFENGLFLSAVTATGLVVGECKVVLNYFPLCWIFVKLNY